MTRPPDSLLFVCGENALRSPMAEGVVKRLHGARVYVDSVGVRAGALDTMAVAVMGEIGIDISGHRPKRLGGLMDGSFALVVALSPEAHGAALELAPARFPLDPAAFIELADLALHEGDTARARQLLIAHDALTAHEPIGSRVARLTRIADLSLELDDPADAVVRFRQARALGEPSTRLLVRLADAEWRTGDRAAARLVIADGLAQSPRDRNLLALQRRFD